LSNLDRSSPTGNLGKSEDIPAALRDRGRATSSTPASKLKPQLSMGKMAGLLAVLLAGGAAWATMTGKQTVNETSQPTSSLASDGDASVVRPGNVATKNEPVDSVLRHLPYTEAPATELVSIGGRYRLRKAAAIKFQAMIAAARSSGVNITTISAFRSVEEQKRLFFGIGAERAQQPTKRAEVSAPPKYSEHHTGYAVDLGDANVPATNLNQNFETTRAYKWLKANAARYSFELSFPKNNVQQVSYEPWHWRFVGDIHSLETFYKARKLINN
jgi:zinc D-Ala-D-Ala carboxypeptidase